MFPCPIHLRRQVKKLLKKRDHLAVVRLELSIGISEAFRTRLAKLVKIEVYQICIDGCPNNMGYIFRLTGELPKETAAELLYKPYSGRLSEDISRDRRMIEQVQQNDNGGYFIDKKIKEHPYNIVKVLNHAFNRVCLFAHSCNALRQSRLPQPKEL